MKIKQIISNGTTKVSFGTDQDKTYTIKKVGVQALPGTQIIFNGNTDNEYPVRVGNTSIFEFSFEDTLPVTSIEIPEESLLTINTSKTQIIVDIFYIEDESDEGGNV